MTKYLTYLIILLYYYSSRSSSNRHRRHWQLRSPPRWAVRAARCFSSPIKMHPERYEEMIAARWTRRVDASLSRRPFHRLPATRSCAHWLRRKRRVDASLNRRPFHRLPAPRSWAHWLWRPKPRRRWWVYVFSFHHVPSILHYFNALIKWIYFLFFRSWLFLFVRSYD